MNDEITVWTKNGSKEKMRKYYLTMYLKEAHAIFTELYQESKISFSKFCSLKPKNVLLLKRQPLDQCKCETHENFRLKLAALDVNIDHHFWSGILCHSDDLTTEC